MITDRELSAAIGATAHDADGGRLGTVEHFYVDDRTGVPTWVALSSGLFGTRHAVVPTDGAEFADGALRLPVTKERVRSAPDVPDPSRLDPATEEQLRRHYGLTAPEQPGSSRVGEDLPPGAAPVAEGGRHADPQDEPAAGWSSTQTAEVPVGAVHGGGDEPPGPVPIPPEEAAAARRPDDGTDGDATTVVHEERLQVGRERVPARRMRLVKYVVTEEVQVTVPVRREEVRLEEVPLDGDAGTPAGSPAGPPEGSLLPQGAEPTTGVPDEIVLHAERPVVGVEVVAVERVRLRVDRVTGEERVEEQVQRERIALDE